MIKICDTEARLWISEKLEGYCLLPDGMDLQDDIDIFMSKEHYSYIVEGGRGLFCYSVNKDYINVAYVWSDMSIYTHKRLIEFGKMLYKRYTIDNKIPIYYSGLKNFYPNHSVEVSDCVWQFKPKDY